MAVHLPRESREIIAVPVEVDGVASTSFEVAVTRWPARPADGDWSSAVVDEDEAGPLVQGLTFGTYQVWVRVGQVVIMAGVLEVD